MGAVLNFAQKLQKPLYAFEFSICTLVTRKEEYNEMLTSFIDKGFDTSCCEYLYLDNSESNIFDAYSAYNLFLKLAKGKYIIMCHQDIILHADGIIALRNKLQELDHLDQNWGICGNAGAVVPNQVVYHITYPGAIFKNKGNFPQKVSSLDENFIIVKNNADLKVSTDLKGFHLYATDLCLQGELNGLSAYVIAFNLMHKSWGNKTPDFFVLREQLQKKYSRFFRSRWVQTNTTVFYLSGSPFKSLFGNPVSLFVIRMINGLKKKWK